MKRFKAEVGDTTALYGLVCGPFTLASHLRGTNIFMDMYDDPDYVKELMAFTTEVAKAFADYYIEAGMDIIGAVDPLVSQISPDSFRQFISEPYTDFFNHVNKQDVYSSFFVCGDATKNLEPMSETKPHCLSIDENIDLVKAKEVTDKYGITLSGNIQLTVVMLLGTQQDSQQAAIEKIDQMGKKGFILAPGCDMPFDVPKANVIGVSQAVQNYSATKKALENYTKADMNIDVELPDYANLEKTLIEVFTIDSMTCAACGYMKAAADGMISAFPGKVEVVERKITEPENIARLGKMGIANLPTIAINGEVKYISVIPHREELKSAVEETL
jgi:uroporphyrinogen decarboxylase